MFPKEKFSERVLHLRSQQNIKQSTLAEAIGVSDKTISMIETGQRAASIEVLYELAKYFEVSTDYLLGLSDDPSRH